MANKPANRLLHETSPYLLQHAHNPVDWYPWGPEAFAKARAENKPILLSIGYSACHWCHVMERESFENEEIAALMNELFVNVKVDREERPDLDEIYMSAVQMLTGRGGWPMTVFLTPEGKPFYGGTYFPPEDRYGMPGFPRILKAVAAAYRDRPREVGESVSRIVSALQGLSASRETQRPFSPDIIARSVEKLAESYDAENGGFGRAPKFPHPGVYELFLRQHHHGRDPRPLEMVVHTLERMANGGIYDQLGGGFHRYSVDEKWLVPHFEKMLYDNAQLVRIYALTYRATANERFREVMEETVDYLLREMAHPEGGFYSTQDADSEGREGEFFLWTADEVLRVIGADRGEIFCRIYDVGDPGNFEGKSILHRILSPEQAGRYFRMSPGELTALLEEARRELFAARERRVKPFRDEKILASWNGLALSGLAEAIKVSPRPAYLEAARRTREFLLSKLVHDGRLLHVYKDGTARLAGYLDDYAFLGLGLLDLYEATLERSCLERAEELAEQMVSEFWDESEGAFFYTGRSHETLIARPKPAFDGSIPSGNAAAAHLLLRLSYYSGNTAHGDKAERVLRCYYEAMESQPFGFAHMLSALDFHLKKPKEIVVAGGLEEPRTRQFLDGIRALYLPNATLRLASAGELPPGAEAPAPGKAAAYVCHNFSCSLPATDWPSLKTLLVT
ncbi:MAG TPA: thioredoxin domain-containing protein [candidate division Zixibacteria bacterium]|nr:thioredoxin domain-containing protein [candidate division Zixibacteria bacterium]